MSAVAPRAGGAGTDASSAYRAAFIDWLACACAGADERAARAVRASGAGLTGDVAFAATAGHVLDFDDTFSEGVAHVSAACAPTALVVAAHLGRSLRATLAAYAEGWEAMAAVAAASHPALYDAGWHPTAVCAPIGAAVAASQLLDLPPSQREDAIALGLLRAGGTRGTFGSDGKAIQVGSAAAAGVQAALLARAGAGIDRARSLHGPLGFTAVLGAGWPEAGVDRAASGSEARAIEGNWIKLSPSCLGTHAPIEVADHARKHGYRPGEHQLTVLVHPLARQAAHLDLVDDGLSAKFSIPYCVAHTLIHGPPRVGDFGAIDAGVRDSSRRVTVMSDGSLPEFGAALVAGERELAHVSCPRGAPERPATPAQLAAKISALTGDRLQGLFDDLDLPATAALEAAGLQGTRPDRAPR